MRAAAAIEKRIVFRPIIEIFEHPPPDRRAPPIAAGMV